MIYMTPQLSIPLGASWGQMITPVRWGSRVKDGRPWCMDNGIFSGRFNEAEFWAKMRVMLPYRDTCLFVVAPDVVGNAIATMDAYRYWGARIKAEGWPVAFVAQDGQELYPFPPEYDALFIGGSTEWKMSNAALECVRRAKTAGKWVHVGRVNSQRRIAHFQIAGVDSVDGTGPCYKPDRDRALFERQLAKRPLFVF